jgi:Uma2 family endonuclease
MTTPAVEKLLTIDEFEALDDPEDGSTLELDEGRLVIVTGGSADHGLVGENVREALRVFLRVHPLGRIMGDATFRLDRTRRIERVPDIAYLAMERVPSGDARKRPIDGAPDLVIEVTSPHDRVAELARKVRQYLEAGSQRVWVVQPSERQVTVYWPDGAARIYGEDATLTSGDAGFEAEGFAVRVGDLFD